jgi:hypothetical protein
VRKGDIVFSYLKDISVRCFFAHSIMFGEGILDQNFSGFLAEIRRDKLKKFLIGVFSIYGKTLLAYSPNTFIFSMRAMFGVFGDDFVLLKPL